MVLGNMQLLVSLFTYIQAIKNSNKNYLLSQGELIYSLKHDQCLLVERSNNFWVYENEY